MRNVLFLCAKELVPVTEGGEGRGSHRRFDYEGLARLAVIGAFYKAGIEISLAARLVQELGEEASFHNMANLFSFIKGTRSDVFDAMDEDNLAIEHAFYLHDTLRNVSNDYRSNTGMLEDALISIYDRQFVFLNHLIINKQTETLEPWEPGSALYKITGWKKGSSELRLDHSPPHYRGKPPPEWSTARTNFKGMIRVNASLSIRNALDTIAAARGG